MPTQSVKKCSREFICQDYATIHQIFEASAERMPHKVAVADGYGQKLTYRQLNRCANRVAVYLRKNNIQPGTLIGISMQRSVNLLVVFLGALKAGCAYLPIDPTLPRQRIREIFHESEIKVLLTQTQLAESFLGMHVECISIERIYREITVSVSNPAYVVEPQDTMYVIYTSGSSGRPKGVSISHSAFKNFLLAIQQLVGIDERDTLLAITTISFDISMLELYLPLLVNATCILAQEELLKDMQQLRQVLNEQSVSIMQATPVIWYELLEAGWFSNKNLKVLCGGEALPISLANRIIQRQGPFWNLYGPTETTVWVTGYFCEQTDEVGEYLPIGKPLHNVQCYVLDDHGKPVKEGEVGELYIGGAQVANGYLNAPHLTEEKFILNPFVGNSTQKLYVTGDNVYRDLNGTLHYVGRRDRQIKMRGHRIELSEIEKKLMMLPEIIQAVVVCTSGEGFSSQMVAYIIAENTVAAQEIRNRLRLFLPQYMLPHRIHQLKIFPKTTNGKIDREKLLILDKQHVDLQLSKTEVIANHEQMVIIDVWADVFKIEKKMLTPKSDFFEYGGNSLHATRIIAKINQLFDCYLPISSVFLFSTIEQFGEHLQRQGYLYKKELEPIAVLKQRAMQSYPLSFQQEQLYFLNMALPDPGIYNVFYAYELNGNLNVVRLESAFKCLIERHEILRTKFVLNDIEPQQMIVSFLDIEFSLPIIDLEMADIQKINQFIDKEKRQIFNLSQPGLLRVKLLRLGADHWILMITMHHIITDGWSSQLLKKELSHYYNVRENDRGSLPPLRIQYIDYAAWQKKQVEDHCFDSQLMYWKTQLCDAPILHLRYDYPLSNRTHFSGKSKMFVLDAEIIRKLKEFSRQQQVTLFVTLLAVFNLLLYSISKQNDIVVGSPISGRHHVDINQVMGFFANMLVLRNDLSGNPNFVTFLQRVKQTTLEGFNNQDVPFEKVVQELNVNINRKVNPFFQVGFSYQQWGDNNVDFDGVQFVEREESTVTSKFDLVLFIIEREGRLTGLFEYSDELFKEESINNWIRRFKNILNLFLANPQCHCEAVCDQQRWG